MTIPKEQKAEIRALRDALRVANKRIRITSDRLLQANLEASYCTSADAYRIGVGEGQDEIVGRIAALLAAAKKGVGS